MGKFVLGTQRKNPYCSEKRLDSLCKMVIYFFGLGSILLGLSFPFFVLISRAIAEELIINGQPGAYGIAYAAYKIRDVDILNDNNMIKT